jgi:hypothetical protein
MQRSYPSVDTGNAQSLCLPAGIALDKLDEVVTHKRIRWLVNADQLEAGHADGSAQEFLCLVIQVRFCRTENA